MFYPDLPQDGDDVDTDVSILILFYQRRESSDAFP